MDQHALLLHTIAHRTNLDPPDGARRRAELSRQEAEARAARRHEQIRRAANAVAAFHGRRKRHADSGDLREALR